MRMKHPGTFTASTGVVGTFKYSWNAGLAPVVAERSSALLIQSLFPLHRDRAKRIVAGGDCRTRHETELSCRRIFLVRRDARFPGERDFPCDERITAREGWTS